MPRLPVVVDFWAPKFAPSHKIAPMVKKLRATRWFPDYRARLPISRQRKRHSSWHTPVRCTPEAFGLDRQKYGE